MSYDAEAVKDVVDLLTKLIIELEAMMKAEGLKRGSLERSWACASSFELYSAYCTCWELLHSWLDATGPTDGRGGLTGGVRWRKSVIRNHKKALHALLNISTKVASNSDLHLSLAAATLQLEEDLCLPLRNPFSILSSQGLGSVGGARSGMKPSAIIRTNLAERGVIRVLQARYGPFKLEGTLVHLLKAAKLVAAEMQV